MSANVSDRLREALEQLDQAIDRLDARVTAHLESRPHAIDTGPTDSGPADTGKIAERLDYLIRRIESSLAN